MSISKYGVEQVKTLEGIQAIRLRPGMYVGSVGIDGLHHIVLEIVSNSIDEYLAGVCTKISVEVGENDIIVVTDNGRGVPFGKAKDGSETIENIFTKLHTGAKFDSDGSSGYNSSGGMNGVGSKGTNALSEYFNVSSIRDGKHCKIGFKKGIKEQFKIENWKNNEHGTSIQFRPDKEIFKEGITLDKNRLEKQLKELSFLCSNLIIEFTYKNEPTVIFQTKNGMVDYIKDLVSDEKRITNIFSIESKEENYFLEMALCYSSEYSEKTRVYTNNIPNSAGTHLTGFRAAMTRTVNDCARELKLLKEKDDNLTGEDLKEGLVLVLSLKMRDPVFNGQTKETLTSSEGRTVVERLVGKEIRKWFEKNPNELKTIVSKALLSKKARVAAKKARELTREKTKSVLTTKMQGKLVDCNSKDPEITEIFLVEGDSAGGQAKQARNKDIQAILPLQGKILNSEKNDFSKLANNNEIKSMITAIGCGVGSEFDYEKLRYSKIIIMADADKL